MDKLNGWGALARTLERVLVCASMLVCASFAVANVYTYDGPPGVGYNSAAGEVLDIVGKYDSTGDLFSWSVTLGRNNKGKLANGFWLVVSNGPNPKDLAPGSELAILYVDARASQKRITAYEYDGENADSSYQDPGAFLGSFSGLNVQNSDNNNTRTISFNDLDVSGINASLNDPGISFANKIGIWMHPVVLKNGTSYYDKSDRKKHRPGMIKDWRYSAQGWYDSEGECSVGFNKPDCEDGGGEVPEPSTMLLFLAGALGLETLARRRTI
jgi:PEP-CTERM motif